MADKIYERFDSLRKSKDVTVYAVSKATGITTTTFTNWKKGKYTPKQDKLQLIANYFGVSLDFLTTGEEFDVYSDEVTDLYAKIRSDKELAKALLIYFELSDEQKNHIIDNIKMIGGVNIEKNN